MTFEELKKHLNTMDADQLKQSVTIRTEEYTKINLAEDFTGEIFFVYDWHGDADG